MAGPVAARDWVGNVGGHQQGFDFCRQAVQENAEKHTFQLGHKCEPLLLPGIVNAAQTKECLCYHEGEENSSNTQNKAGTPLTLSWHHPVAVPQRQQAPAAVQSHHLQTADIECPEAAAVRLLQHSWPGQPRE